MMKINVKTFLLINLVLIIFSLIFSLKIIDYFSNKVLKVILPIAEEQTRKVISSAINKATDNVIIDSERLYSIVRNDSNEIQLIQYNSFEVTKLINTITGNIQKLINNIEDNNNSIIEKLPFGLIFGNTMLGNIGPKVDIKLYLLGDIISNIQTEVKPYGINNAYVELQIHLEITARIVLPFTSKKIVIQNVIPLSMTVVSGSVPEAIISSYK